MKMTEQEAMALTEVVMIIESIQQAKDRHSDRVEEQLDRIYLTLERLINESEDIPSQQS